MPFIGNQPALSYTSFAKQDFTTSATTSYTLDNPVANANELALFINFVRQEPTTAYTASGTSLTLTSATASTDDMYCVFLGKAVQTVNPPSGSVGLSQLSATGTKDATTFLRGDNTFASAGGTNTPAFLAYNSSGDTISNSSYTKIEFDTEVYDTASAFDTTNDRFVVPSGQGGYYTLYGVVNGRNTSNEIRTIQILFYKNGSRISSKYDFASVNNSSTAAGIFRGFSLSHTITVNLSASDYIEVYTYMTVSTGSPMVDEASIFGGYKLIT